MQKERGKGLELIEKLIRKQSGVDNMDDPPECYGWFYQPKRPEKFKDSEQ